MVTYNIPFTRIVLLLACCLVFSGCQKAIYDLPTVEKAIAEDVGASEIKLTETETGFTGTFVDSDGESFDVEVTVTNEGKKMSWIGQSSTGIERTGKGEFKSQY